MNNYLMLNGKRIDLTEEQIKDIKQSFDTGDVQLSSVKAANTFKIGEYELFVLEQLGDTTAVMLKNPIHDEKQFGSNNNYDGSDVDKLCIEFGEVIEKLVGADNLVEHTVDLTADDGLKCYSSIQRKMSLLTAEQYRKYVYIIDEHKLDKWWWLATAYSTPKHDDESWIKCVSPFGSIYYINYYYNFGVRPFCILKSNIFVSK
ncbi:MAG: hypothetical protein J6D52_00110 [Clostridia bacterium]|nr:hypothetical protein [Clostridia bacterium]